jgi:hypothetical protein
VLRCLAFLLATFDDALDWDDEVDLDLDPVARV